MMHKRDSLSEKIKLSVIKTIIKKVVGLIVHLLTLKSTGDASLSTVLAMQ